MIIKKKSYILALSFIIILCFSTLINAKLPSITSSKARCSSDNYVYSVDFDSGLIQCREDISNGSGGGSSGGNPFDQSLNTTDSPTFQNLTINNSLKLNNGSATLNISNGKELMIALEGSHAQRTSKVIIEGSASGAGDKNPFLLINATSHNGNSALMKMLVNNAIKFLLDSDGDLTVGRSITAGTYGFTGTINEAILQLNANNGMKIWTYQPNDIKRGRVTIGQDGTNYLQDTPSVNLDFDYLTIRKDIHNDESHIEAGSLLRLERDVTNFTSTSGNFLEWADDTKGELGKFDKNGAIWFDEYIYQYGNSNTFIRLNTNSLLMGVGGMNYWSMVDSGQDILKLNQNNNDIDFAVYKNDSGTSLTIDAVTGLVNITNNITADNGEFNNVTINCIIFNSGGEICSA